MKIFISKVVSVLCFKYKIDNQIRVNKSNYAKTMLF